MPPSLPPLLFFSPLFLLLLLTASPGSTAHAQTSRRLLQSTLPPPPPPHHHHHRTPRSPPPSPPQPNPAPPTPTPPKQTPVVSLPPASAPPPAPTLTPIPTLPPPTPTSTSSATPTPDAYPFTNYPFFPSSSPPPPLPEQQSQPSGDASRTFPANISNLVAPNSPTPSGSSRPFPLFQALLLAFLSLFLLLLSALLAIHLFRRLRPAHQAANGPTSSHSVSSSARRDDDDGEEGDEEGRSLKPPPMPTSSTNPSTEFLYLGTLASSATPSAHPRPGSPELRPLPPLPRTGPPSGEFFASLSSHSTAVPRAGANPSSASSSSLSPSSPSASSPTLGSSPAHFRARPPSIPQPRGRARNPSPPKRRPSPPPPPPHQSWNPFAPASPPPRASPSDDDGDGESYTTEMRKSRPLHSDKLKPGSLHMKDEMIQLYLNNSAAMAAAAQEVCLLGAPRCRGIGMLLGALGVSEERVRDALLEGNAHGLGVEVLRMLTQLVPTNEEELKLRYFKDDPSAKLCKVDAFLKTILDVPFAFKRVDAMLYVSNFYLEVNQLRMSYATLEAACQELRSSRLFHRVLGAVLNFGNLMSINTGSPNSQALEPNTLLKIVDVKGADGKAALLHFVVQEIVKPEGHNSLNTMHSGSVACKAKAGTLPYDVNCRKHGLQVVSTLAAELTSTKKAAFIDITSLSRIVSELGAGLGKIHNVLRLNSMIASSESTRRFHVVMGTFLRQAEEEIIKLQAQESVCLSAVKEMAEYFHGGDSASGDEARMSRLFAGVREFVAMLDRICREAGEINGDCVGSTTLSWTAAAPMVMTTATP